MSPKQTGDAAQEDRAIPTAFTTAAARTALHALTALREVTGKTAEVQALNDAIDSAIAEAEKILVTADKEAGR